jgi:hypothetical protein
LSFTAEVVEAKGVAREQSGRDYASNSSLAQGDWYKIGVDTTGVFRMGHSDLVALGMENTIDAGKIKLFGYGKGMLPEAVSGPRPDDLPEIPLKVVDRGDGTIDPGDYILFYTEAPDEWAFNAGTERYYHHRHIYADTNYYFLTTGETPGKRIEQAEALPGEPTFTTSSYDYLLHHEKDMRSLINSGRRMLGEVFDLDDVRRFTFNIPDRVSSAPASFHARLVAKSTSSSSFTINAGSAFENIAMPSVSTSYNSKYAQEQLRSFSFDPQGDELAVKITYNKANASSIGWLDYFSINMRRKIVLQEGQLLFRDKNSIGQEIVEYELQSGEGTAEVWDVTNLYEIEGMPLQTQQGKYRFKAASEELREFVAYDGSHFLTPVPLGKVPNQNLHGMSNTVDYVIIIPDKFSNEASRLASFHRSNSDLEVKVVKLDAIYNEFSSGMQDISAIRDFLKLLYDSSEDGQGLQYVLLFGDGSFDHKDIIEDNTNIVPTYQTPNSLHPVTSYTSDDFFGYLDDGEGDMANDMLDIGIGRLPVATLEEAKVAVDKIIHYGTADEAVMKPWRNVITFVADDGDGNSHLNQADNLAAFVSQNYLEYNIEKIYFDAYRQVTTPGGKRYPAVTENINTRVESGALFVNYTGHGGETGWAHERVLGIPDIQNWSNYNRLPVFVTATCEFSRFDDPERVSAGELVFKHPNGGSIALFTTTRATYGNPNFSLNKSFYRHALRSMNGKIPRMGDLIRLSKEDNGSSDNNRKFVLLGDPALKIAYPEKQARVTHINDSDIEMGGDTLKALSNATIVGEIIDNNGSVASDFNGIVYPTIYDKSVTVTTLGNDQGSYPTDFELQKSVLYKGKADVVEGRFEFSFIVPKDIDYKLGTGKISLYAAGENTDAHGHYNDVMVGGFYEAVAEDVQGPDINLYINDPGFEEGGLTGPNPVLYATISDASGINTVGNGIGHDLVAYIDNTEDVKVLNDYYEADLNTYKSGSVVFPFFNVPEGDHTLHIKAWDVFNNSSKTTLSFKVVDKDKLKIQRLKNYPNPVTDHTRFVFEHNQKNQHLTIELEIFDMNGNRVYYAKQEETSGNANKIEPILWHGENASGRLMKKGVYIYTLKVTAGDELVDQQTKKLLLIK